MNNLLTSPIPYTLEQLLMHNPDLEYHHTATVPGYVSRKASTEIITHYKGRFGQGFIVHRPRYDSTRYHVGTYYIFKREDKPMIMNVNLEFRRAAQLLPKKSGNYVCISGCCLQLLNYSAKFNRFNQYDWQDKPDENAIKVAWWAPLPAGLQNLN